MEDRDGSLGVPYFEDEDPSQIVTRPLSKLTSNRSPFR